MFVLRSCLFSEAAEPSRQAVYELAIMCVDYIK